MATMSHIAELCKNDEKKFFGCGTSKSWTGFSTINVAAKSNLNSEVLLLLLC